ncbi:MAG: FMN-binding glutamate synthase family protein [Deltaproteobacteria bacterium]|nr:FMN-binding glutamate synthase family protein [Deltaproteobacteria bacterium]
MTPRNIFVLGAGVVIAGISAAAYVWPPAAWAFVLVGPPILLGLYDMLQTRHALRRNYPLVGHGRYLLESIRPEINQYFVESDVSGTPFNREKRSLIYQRAKGVRDTVPFGTQRNVYDVGYEWINHSIAAKEHPEELPRIMVGGKDCKQPYDLSLLNVSAMSFGSLSRHAIIALNRAAKQGHFAHNTGEGGLSPHHEQGGDLIWQIGTGYFGARNDEGGFSEERFAQKATTDAVKMVEIKVSQGAKPGHGGILPAAKVTPEIAKIRHVPLGKDVLSPPTHSSFGTPLEMMKFITTLRDLSGGKPVGFKLCIGKHREFFAIVKAMLETGVRPDFITVDGGEGGTGAAPLEFSNVVGTPLVEGLVFVHNALTGAGLREEIRVLASGKVASGFDIAHKLAVGADATMAARSMMFALGCIQARRCNTNHCPVGIATQLPSLVSGLVIPDKAERVRQYHDATLRALNELVAAAGLDGPGDLRPWHIQRRVSSTDVRHYDQIYQYIEPGSLLGADIPEAYARAWHAARPDSFEVLDSRQRASYVQLDT